MRDKARMVAARMFAAFVTVGLAFASTLAVAVMPLAASATPVDGVNWMNATHFSFNWSSPRWWKNSIVAGGGGRASFLGYANKITIDRADLRLSKLDMGTLDDTVKYFNAFVGNDITFVGDAPELAFSGKGSNRGVGYDVEIGFKGTGANALGVTGPGLVTLTEPISNFGWVNLFGGTLSVTNGAEHAVAGCPIRLYGGKVLWQPRIASGTVCASTLGTTLAVGPAISEIKLTKGNASSQTLTLPSLGDTPGVVFLNADDLGGTQKIKLAGDSPVKHGDLVDPTFLHQASALVLKRLAYSAEDGFTVADVTEKSLAEAGASDHVRVDVATTLSASKTVASLHCVTNAAPIIPSGTTLTVGDGTGSALVWMDVTPKAWRVNSGLEGQGTLAFGSALGKFVFNQCEGSGEFTNHVGITGSAGVAFLSNTRADDHYINILWDQNTQPPAWTGPTYLSRLKFYVNREDANAAGLPNCFPQTGDDNDVYLYRAQVSLRPRGDNFTFGNHFYLSGYLPHSASESDLSKYAAIYCRSIGGGSYTFNGPVDVLSDSGIAAVRESVSSMLYFNGGIGGGGDLTFFGAVGNAENGGAAVINSACTASGRWTANAIGVSFVSPGAPGTGKLITQNKGKYVFQGHSALTVANDFEAETVIVRDATVTFTGSGHIGKLILQGNARAVLNDNLSYDEADAFSCTSEGDKITGGKCESVWSASGATNVLTKIEDGVLPAAVSVTAGTVKLEPDVFLGNDVAYWLDATQPDTLLLDGDNKVIRWMSANGNGYFFTNRTFGINGSKMRDRPAYGREARKINSQNTVTFDGADAKYQVSYANANAATGLMGKEEVLQRTVFIVLRTKTYTTWGAPFGRDGADYGFRMNGSGPWESKVGAATHLFGQKGLIINGVNTNNNKLETTQVVVMEHTTDMVSVVGDSPSLFVPSIGADTGFFDSTSHWRAFDGDIAEVIAFNRILSENERKRIENYLARKWGVSDELYPDVPETTGAFMSPDAAISVEGEGALDLNGEDLAVASLSGSGTIRNSGANAATLSVTGSCTFAGTVATNVTLAPGAGAKLASKFETGAALALAAGTTTLDRHVTGIPTNGISMWLDAMKAGSIETNSEGRVTKWYRRDNVARYFYTVTTSTTKPTGNVEGAYQMPTYEATGLNGKPSVFFNEYGNLSSSSAFKPQTLFIVGKLDAAANQLASGGIWGLVSKDSSGDQFGGLRITWSQRTSVTIMYPEPYANYGDTIRLNGVDKSDLEYIDFGTSVYRLVHRAGANVTMPTWNWRLNVFNYNGGAREYVSEVLAYDRRLGDDEILQVEAYLKAKWIDGTVTSETANDVAPIADGGTALKAPDEGTATVIPMNFALSLGLVEWTVQGSGEGSSLAQIVVDGDATFAANSYAGVVDFQNLNRKQTDGYLCLKVNGETAGDFSGSSLDGNRRWALKRNAGKGSVSWRVVPVCGGIVLLMY